MSFESWWQSHKPASRDQAPLTEEEAALMTRVAAKVVEWKMTVPAIMFLESVKPLNYIGAQTMVFFEPFIQTIFNFKDYDAFRQMMERRENVERLLLRIEELDAAALEQEKADRRERRAQRARSGRRWWWPFGGRDDDPKSPEPPVVG